MLGQTRNLGAFLGQTKAARHETDHMSFACTPDGRGLACQKISEAVGRRAGVSPAKLRNECLFLWIRLESFERETQQKAAQQLSGVHIRHRPKAVSLVVQSAHPPVLFGLE